MGTYDKLKAGKPLTLKEAEEILGKLNFHLSHTRGSHRHWVGGGQIFIIPAHGKDLKRWVTRELRKLYHEKIKPKKI